MTPANPAVTLALGMFRKFSWGKILNCLSVQVARAFLGAGLVYLLDSPIIDHFNSTEYLACAYGGVSGVSFTHPGATITPIHAFGDQIVLATILIFGIFAITEQCSKMALQTSQRLAPSFRIEIPVLWKCSRSVENL
ncbi:MAG: aquaporin [Acidobacteriaceae bacterium]